MSVSKEISLSGQVEFGNILMARHEMDSHNFIRYIMLLKKIGTNMGIMPDLISVLLV